MFYSNKSGPPAPADPLYSVHVTERKRWQRDYDRHQNAVSNVKGMVDQRKPKCHDYKVIKTLENTRKFVDSQKKAFIERENSKMADRINQISSGSRYRSVSGQPLNTSQSADTLHATRRRRVDADVKRDNASMVKRLLQVKTSPDVRRVSQEKDYVRHQKYKVLLAKIHPLNSPTKKRKPEKLPPVEQGDLNDRAAAAANSEGLWQGLDCFLLQNDTGIKDGKKRKPKEKRAQSHDSAGAVTANILSVPNSRECAPGLSDMVKDVVRNVVMASLENYATVKKSREAK